MTVTIVPGLEQKKIVNTAYNSYKDHTQNSNQHRKLCVHSYFSIIYEALPAMTLPWFIYLVWWLLVLVGERSAD